MAHKEQREFCLAVKAMFPDFFRDKTVLDMGSLDINGSNRYLFENCTYIGIDLSKGENVDVVVMAHEFSGGPFDPILHTEMPNTTLPGHAAERLRSAQARRAPAVYLLDRRPATSWHGRKLAGRLSLYLIDGLRMEGLLPESFGVGHSEGSSC